VPIQEQPLQVLRLLLEAEGKVVRRDQLRSVLWLEDTFVDFEHGVNTAVKKLRQALEDSAENPRFIETLPKVGYRFITPVEWIADGSRSSVVKVVPIAPLGPVAVPRVAPRKRRWKLKAAVLAALLVLAATVLLLIANSDSYHARAGKWLRTVLGVNHLETQPVLSQRRLTANPAETPITGGILSPDGKYLAYADPRGFHLRLVDSGETHVLSMPDGFAPLPESWFPDNVHMVVSWIEDPVKSAPSLWKISVLGGTPRKLTTRGSSARVSPDGLKIAFLAGPWDDEEIWLVQSDGRNQKRIVDGGWDGFGAVAWAPNGKAFACVRTIRNQRPERSPKQIEVYDVASGRSKVILSDPMLGDHIARMTNGRLFYSLEEPGPNQSDQNLWSLQLEDESWRVSGPPTKITNDRGFVAGISVADDGKRMTLLRRTSQADVYVAEVDVQRKRLDMPRRLTLDDRADWPNAWTPDSKSVLFRSDRDGPVQIFKQNVMEAQPELLVNGNENNIAGGPRLTSDGLSVLYTVNAKPGTYANLRPSRDPIAGGPSHSLRLMRVPVTGGTSQFVLEEPGITNFQCAAHPSNLCIYGQLEPNFPYHKFFIFDPERGKAKEILVGRMKNEDGLNFWTLSPDGKHIVTAKSQNPYEQPALRIFDVDTGQERQIPIPDIRLIYGMDWAADSKTVWLGAFMSRGAWGTRSGIVNVALTGKIWVALKSLNPEIWYAIPSADGRRLALMGLTQNSNIWLLENF
jgi:Tol biopolymer transport system component